MTVSVPLITTTTLSSFANALQARGVPIEGALRHRRLPTSWVSGSSEWVPYLHMRAFLADVAAREAFPQLGQLASRQSGQASIDPGIQSAVFRAPSTFRMPNRIVCLPVWAIYSSARM